MQPKAMKHSIVSTYIDIHRVGLMMYVVWKSSLRETGLRAKNHTLVSSRCNLNPFSIPSQVSSKEILLQAADSIIEISRRPYVVQSHR